jgi:hypothetical protein
MNGIIDSNGFLKIERNGGYKHQDCPFTVKGRWCGDWCPLFEEPNLYMDTSAWVLSICHTILYFDQFKDERC